MYHLVYFNDLLEDDSEPHFGLLNTEEKTVQCFCCGGILEDGDYKIRKEWPDMGGIDGFLKNVFVEVN